MTMTKTERQKGIDAIADVQKFYRTHEVGGGTNWHGEHSPDIDNPRGSMHCIWGAAILTGHAKPNGMYGRNMTPAMKSALEATIEYPEDMESWNKGSGLGGYNDTFIFLDGYSSPSTSKGRMRAWLKRAKAWLK